MDTLPKLNIAPRTNKLPIAPPPSPTSPLRQPRNQIKFEEILHQFTKLGFVEK
jgi:hypothetical protein